MRLTTLAITAIMFAFVGTASATSKVAPLPPVKPTAVAPTKPAKKPLKESCKIIKGKKKCHKSPYKSKMTVEPYKGKPPTAKKTK